MAKVMVTGNTYAAKGALKQFGFKWNADKKAWFGTLEQKENIVNSARAISRESSVKDAVLALGFEEVK